MFKSALKKVIGENNWSFVSWYRDRFGLLPAMRRMFGLLVHQGTGIAPNPINGKSVFLRPGTADQTVYSEIFLVKEYDIDLGNPAIIVDAGAHIGLSSVFFASKYPNATVLALEPEPSNFELLLKNVRDYPNIKPLQVGLWSRCTHLRIQDSGVSTWSFRVAEDPSGTGIPAVGIGKLLQDFGNSEIDVLKIDIEGSEVEVLSCADAWMNRVKTLIIELHDRFRPGCSQALAQALDGYSYDESISGESIVITNLRRTVACENQ